MGDPRRQLLGLGYSSEWIRHAVASKRLYPIHAGVYAVGRRDLTPEGYFIAAVLACGPRAVLSHESAAELWQILRPRKGDIHVSVPTDVSINRPGIKVHRRSEFEATRRRGIPVTTLICTIVDLATSLNDEALERSVNEAANRDLVDPERLRRELDTMRGRRGVPRLAKLLDRDTYAITDTELEQRFLRIVRKAGLPIPRTQRHLEGGRVDFYWPDLNLIVEADSLRFHRTPSQQRADRLRDQKHAAA